MGKCDAIRSIYCCPVPYQSTRWGFGARQVIDPDILFVLTVEEFAPVEEAFLALRSGPLLRIDGREPRLQWSSGLPGFVKVALRLGGEIPSAVTVSTGSDEVCLVIPKPGV